MKTKSQIYCIEGVHDWGEGEIEPTVEPMLELLKKVGYWDYLHRTCATIPELEYRLKTEWHVCCAKGSILYFCTHGGPDQVWLSDDQNESLLTIKEWINCEGCHIHFGGCDTLSKGTDNLKDFMETTKATSVSGYATESGWIGRNAPALTLELQLFGMLSEDVTLARNDRYRPGKLREVKQRIGRQFRECEFDMLVRRHKKT